MQIFSFTDHKEKEISLCPVLGKVQAEVHNGPCPKHLQKPHRKELKISFIGSTPFIKYRPIGGSEFLLVKILAKKYKFFPKYIPEKSFDVVRKNGTFHGMFYRVRVQIEFLNKSLKT